ncbi:phage portal protein [Acetobacter sacchari]|uniref:Phage portal protein n=1 Tax=Acetobacter sacchari TaxID=2661687 RepID=A0ABS3M111_9PROT|nr:phage portal protein [Acetobacter sacchari]MBO1361786.1 phage portal protein [Acetobacter sacchari]
MDWLQLKGTYPAPKDQPARCGEILARLRVLDGTLYDDIPNPFSKEYSGASEYIKLDERRPSIRTHMITTVIEDAVSLLFGDKHFPKIKADNAATQDALTDFVRDAGIGTIMQRATIRGSVGSVAILVEVQNFRLRVNVLDTPYLTPTWNRATGALVKVSERYQVQGSDLREQGYQIADEDLRVMFWFQREWDDESATYYVPVRVSDDVDAAKDDQRSTNHGLGFVPMIWVRNLMTEACDEIDGPCSFTRAIDNMISADYLLSQSGRGLKYSADPKVIIKYDPDKGGGVDTSVSGEGVAAYAGGASQAYEIASGDVKLLEINGTAATTIVEFYRTLRNIVLEQMHGNRADADRMSAAQSGRAMEMMCLGLTWFAGRLRDPYGNGALVSLLEMVCAMSSAVTDGVLIAGRKVSDIDPSGISLTWPQWFPPTPPELLQLAQALVTAVDGNIMSNETACAMYGAAVGTDDAAKEWALVQAQIADKAAQAAQAAGQEAATNTRKAGLDGKSKSHKVQA